MSYIKGVKFIIIGIALSICLVLPGEIYQLYLEQFEDFHVISFYLDESDNAEDMNKAIYECSKNNEILVFKIVNEAKSSILTKINVYGDEKIKKYLLETIKKASDLEKKDPESFEYAVRTVLKWEVDSYSKSDSPTEIKEGDEVLKLSDLHVWVIGGDSFSGDNTITPFPLSWKRPKLLKRDSGTSINGKWYWITWDLSAPAYHTFVVGDVPDDAQKYGPKTWYAGDSYYVPLKQNYKLYPGATLVMQLVSDFKAPGVGSFYFKLTNKGTRWLEPGETE